MNQHNLSISSSKTDSDKGVISQKNAVVDAIKTGLWLVLFLALFDVGINLLFPYPSNPKKIPGKLNLYFDYGRSIEGKIFRQLGRTDESTAPLAMAGWLNPEEWEDRPVNTAPGEDLLIATYGMSFANDVSKVMKEIDSRLTLRLIGGPGAPPNHSFTAYNLDRGEHKADVVMLGVLASSLKGMTALSNMTWGSEVPGPMTYPRYIAENGSLKAVWPEIKSLEELRAAKYQDKQPWEAFVTQMQKKDLFFDSFIFEENFLDNSVIIRMIRRTITQNHQAKITSKIHTQEGFNEELEEIAALKLIVKEFAVTAKQDGKLPIVLLFNDRGYEDHLYQLLRQTLEENSIPFVSTHNIVPATDIGNFLGDGHFTKNANKLIAAEVLKLINQRLERPAHNSQIIDNLLTE